MSELASVNPSAGERVAGNDDLLQQILLRLPAKPLIRFKLVSKPWLSLISDPKFAESHVLRNPSSPPSGMFVDINKPRIIDFFRLGGGTSQAKPTFDFIDNVFNELDRPFSFLQSCNGLFLCSSKNYYHLCVCNPSTKQYRFLPPIKGLSMGVYGWKVSALGFAFDPSISPHYYVVCEKYSPNLVTGYWTFGVDVYSSKDHQWRPFELKETEQNTPHIQLHQDGIFHDGGIHGLGDHSFHFDLKSECLVQRPMPNWKFASVTVMDPVIARRRIIFPSRCVGVRDKYVYKTCSQWRKKLYVFEMSKDYRKWVVKYRLSVCHLASKYPEILTTKTFNGKKEENFAAFALGVVEGVKEEDAELLLAIPDKIISYNFLREEMKTVYNFTAEPAEKINIRTFPFIETLSPV